MTVRELREKYLRFFESKGHLRVPSGSLIPYDVTGRLDESLLFNGAGMVQFKPYFRGVAQPENRRLTNAQKCVRTGDIEEVGDDTHLTFFEMLGNFSFGDYFKAQAIGFSWEFLTSPEWLGLDSTRLSFTIHETDDEAYREWAFHLAAAGIDPDTRVFRLDEETNYWPAGAYSSGPPGPCGPNSEMFYWVAPEPAPSGAYSREDWIRDEADRKWVEIWNDVFIQFEWQGHLKDPSNPKLGYEKDGMPELPFRSIDTGMGLERTALVLGSGKSVYDNDVFTPIFETIRRLRTPSPQTEDSPGTLSPGGRGQGEGESPGEVSAMRIIADHIRTACFCIADGILPGNTGRGYVLRRLIRRAVLKGQRVLGFEQPFFHEVFEGVRASMGDHYTELNDRADVIRETLRNEEALFRRTLKSGESRLLAEIQNLLAGGFWPMRKDVYRLVQQHGENLGLDLPHLFTEAAANDASPNPSSEFKAMMEHLADSFKFARQLRATYFFLSGYTDESPIPMQRMPDGDTVIPLFEGVDDIGKELLIPGQAAFTLYDTYGFPLEVTKELAAEAGFEVDEVGYEQALKEAQERSRGAQNLESVYGGVTGSDELALPDAPSSTEFLGYAETEGEARIVRVRPSANGLRVALDQTPFYAESGGQTGDHGTLTIQGGKLDGTVLQVVNTSKQGGVFWHEVRGAGVSVVEDQGQDAPDTHRQDADATDLLGARVHAQVQSPRRDRIRRNHTATHLLQAALRQTLGTHVTQAGSYVGPDNLRFDFTHGKALTGDEIAQVERLVNEEALKNEAVTTYVDIPISEARAKGAMALFGEKYGDRVRMVEIGDFSRELCGGTHVRTTGEIGLFKIVSESSAQAGVRRIEAITGETAYEWVLEQSARLRQAADLLKASPRDLVPAVERTLDALKEERRRREKVEMAAMGGGKSEAKDETTEIGPIVLWVRNFGDADPKLAATAVDNAAAGKPNQVTLAAALKDGKPTFTAKVGPDAVTAGAHAGNLLREVAKIAGGGGGGRPDFATAGGRDATKVDEALAAAAKILATMVGVSPD